MSNNSTNPQDAPTTTPIWTTAEPMTSIWPELQPFDHTVQDVFGVLTILVCLTTLAGDVFLLLYFLTKKRRPSTLIYYALLLCDLIISSSGIYIGIDSIVYESYTVKRTVLATKQVNTITINKLGVKPPDMDEDAVYWAGIPRYINSYFYAVASRMSAMINCYLSVIRAIVILSPFTKVNVWSMLGTLAFYLLLLVVSLAVLFATNEPNCSHLWMTCEPEIQISDPSTGESKGLPGALILTGIPFFAPCVPVVVSCLLIVGKQITSTGQFGQKMRAGTVTIVYVSCLFIICNSAYLIFSFLQYDKIYSYTDTGSSYNFSYWEIAMFYAFRTFSTFSNALGNVVILLVRSSGVKQFVKEVLNREVNLGEILNRRKRTERRAATALTMSDVANAAERQIRPGVVNAPPASQLYAKPGPLKEVAKETGSVAKETDSDLLGENLSEDTQTVTSVSSNNVEAISKVSKKSKKKKLTKAEKRALKKASQRQHDMIIFGLGDALGTSMIIHNPRTNGSEMLKSDKTN